MQRRLNDILQKQPRQVSELVGEVPGISIDEQCILRLALDWGDIPPEFPPVRVILRDLVGFFNEFSDLVRERGDVPELGRGLDIGDVEGLYLRYILLPKVLAKSSFDYTRYFEVRGLSDGFSTGVLGVSVRRFRIKNDKRDSGSFRRKLKGLLGGFLLSDQAKQMAGGKVVGLVLDGSSVTEKENIDFMVMSRMYGIDLNIRAEF